MNNSKTKVTDLTASKDQAKAHRVKAAARVKDRADRVQVKVAALAKEAKVAVHVQAKADNNVRVKVAARAQAKADNNVQVKAAARVQAKVAVHVQVKAANKAVVKRALHKAASSVKVIKHVRGGKALSNVRTETSVSVAMISPVEEINQETTIIIIRDASMTTVMAEACAAAAARTEAEIINSRYSVRRLTIRRKRLLYAVQ
ncbi:hypothetical protein PBN151_1907 [Paenibacillus sp. NAIST15-1]|nr:hypothetical protein PBN151_1907 [Paenibacillus sp. NAIST15-1]